jgi:ABC-2 type transport system ATP-binding protein
MMKKEDILRVNKLSVKLGGKLILKDITLNVKNGEMLGIVGRSGVGKTTLLNSIIGYCPRSAGEVSYFSGMDYASAFEKKDSFRRLFGFSAQNPSFYPELSVLNNLEYFASLYNIPKLTVHKNIMRALRLVQLEDHMLAYGKHLSGGMRKRLDIACAIVHAPKILILDEPTADMDPLLRIQMWNLMEDINHNGTTILVSSHFLSELEHTCDRIVLLNNKTIGYTGTPTEFRNRYSNVKEIHISTKDGKYDVILKKCISIPFLEVKHVFKRKGRIVLHSSANLAAIKDAISKIGASDVDIIDPSFDALFNLFVK